MSVSILRAIPVLKADQTEADDVGHVQVGRPVAVGDAAEDAALVLKKFEVVVDVTVEVESSAQLLAQRFRHFIE